MVAHLVTLWQKRRQSSLVSNTSFTAIPDVTVGGFSPAEPSACDVVLLQTLLG
jgi:hypothetical protein